MKLGIEPAANGSATVYVGIFSEDLNTKTRRRIEVKTEDEDRRRRQDSNKLGPEK